MPINNRSILMPARWSVVWRSNGRWIEKEVDDDFGEAQRLFTLLVKNGREPQIRSLNVAFPPPKRITEHKKYSIKMVNGKKRKTLRIVNRMEAFNRKGWWWCPYCVRLRKFKRDSDKTKVLFLCPMCGVSSRAGAVKRYNPYALVIEVHRRSSVRRTRRVRRRT